MFNRSLPTVLAALAALVLLVLSRPGASQPDGGDDAAALSPQDIDRMMALMEEMNTPGPAHEALDRFIGAWDLEMRMWMTVPDAPPTVTSGTSTYEWVLDGHWVRSEWEGVLMGRPMSGIGLMGYDNFKKKYVATWVDSATTMMSAAEGLLDQTGDVLTLYGTMDEYLTGEHDKVVKYQYRFTDDDSFTFELHDLGIVPGETRVIEVIYTRADEPAPDAAMDEDAESDEAGMESMHE